MSLSERFESLANPQVEAAAAMAWQFPNWCMRRCRRRRCAITMRWESSALLASARSGVPRAGIAALVRECTEWLDQLEREEFVAVNLEATDRQTEYVAVDRAQVRQVRDIAIDSASCARPSSLNVRRGLRGFGVISSTDSKSCRPNRAWWICWCASSRAPART